MALKRKDTLVQFRIDSETLELFQARCDHYGETVSQALRSAIVAMNNHYRRNVPVTVLKPSEEAEASKGIGTSSEVEKSPVEPIRQSQSLSEKRKAEKLAKQVKLAKRESRYLND
jgi:antitoxin component of RelBE/YafQ-DinJ toxin-antitoxin module